MASASPLVPTFHGHIASTQDALLLFEACLGGALNHVARRPHDRERMSLIKSGNVFIYEEHSSGIKRWTDGVPWSPSRILGNFLVYRELERPFPPGEKKRAMKRSKKSPGIAKQETTSQSSGMSNNYSPTVLAASHLDARSSNPLTKETERSLIGSLIDSYGFKEEGLVKKTVSVTVGGISHHLVSYYTVADVMNNRLITPSKDSRFQTVIPRPDLITKQNFRAPIDEIDSMDRIEDRSVYTNYSSTRNGYEVTNQSLAQRPLLQETPPLTYTSNSAMYSNYGPYDALPSHQQHSYDHQFAPSPGVYTSSKPEAYDSGGYKAHRYNSAPEIVSDQSRSHMSSGPTEFTRRSSNYEQGGAIDSGLSGISSSTCDSKLTTESGYSSHSYYGGTRDTAFQTYNYSARRSLPMPSQPPPVDRLSSQAYNNMEAPMMKENVWTMGNSSAGHAHYNITPQHQWTSTGTI